MGWRTGWPTSIISSWRAKIGGRAPESQKHFSPVDPVNGYGYKYPQKTGAVSYEYERLKNRDHVYGASVGGWLPGCAEHTRGL